MNAETKASEMAKVLAEVVAASSDYARLIQIENFDRNDMAVHRAYERLRHSIDAAAAIAKASPVQP